MKKSSFPSSGWQIGYVIPRLLLIVFVMDAGLRFQSVEPLTFRAWEAMTRYRPIGAAFEPNRQYSNERTYGDSAAMGNLPGLRQYRRETFTTDVFGFRNVATTQNGPVVAILTGDSFAVGSGVSDEETLPSRLSARSGCTVYNAGSEHPHPDPDRVLALARNLNMRGGLVIHLYSEDRELPTVSTTWRRGITQILAQTPQWAGHLIGHVRGLMTVSPLRILSERAMKAAANDRILPNRYEANVAKATVINGDPMLFLTSRMDRFLKKRNVSTEYWTWLGAELRKERLNLLVLLVPGKYTVYRRFLVDQEQRPVGDTEGGYLDRLEHELHEAGVPVLNLTPIFLARAAYHLERGEYLYWLDDIHWNARGIDLAAVALQEAGPFLADASCGDERRSLAARNS